MCFVTVGFAACAGAASGPKAGRGVEDGALESGAAGASEDCGAIGRANGHAVVSNTNRIAAARATEVREAGGEGKPCIIPLYSRLDAAETQGEPLA